MDSSQRFLLASEVADILRLKNREVTQLALSGSLPHVRLPDGRLLFSEADLWTWVRARRQPRPQAVGSGAESTR